MAHHTRVAAYVTAVEAIAFASALDSALIIPAPSLDAVRELLARDHANAALLSVTMLHRHDTPQVAALVRDFPALLVAGVVRDVGDARALDGALQLGHAGITRLFDVRHRTGWQGLRNALATASDPLDDVYKRRVVNALARETSSGWTRFVQAAVDTHTARETARVLGVHHSTLISRFYRADLPSPKRYCALSRLALAAYMVEQPGVSIAKAALRVDASSPQSFGRTVRTFTGMTASEFRARYTGDAFLAELVATMVEPHRGRLRTFDPVAA